MKRPFFLVVASLILVPVTQAQLPDAEGDGSSLLKGQEHVVTAPVAGRPLLEIESQSIDLGKVRQGVAAIGTFVLHNRGDAELRINRVKPG